MAKDFHKNTHSINPIAKTTTDNQSIPTGDHPSLFNPSIQMFTMQDQRQTKIQHQNQHHNQQQKAHEVTHKIPQQKIINTENEHQMKSTNTPMKQK